MILRGRYPFRRALGRGRRSGRSRDGLTGSGGGRCRRGGGRQGLLLGLCHRNGRGRPAPFGLRLHGGGGRSPPSRLRLASPRALSAPSPALSPPPALGAPPAGCLFPGHPQRRSGSTRKERSALSRPPLPVLLSRAPLVSSPTRRRFGALPSLVPMDLRLARPLLLGAVRALALLSQDAVPRGLQDAAFDAVRNSRQGLSPRGRGELGGRGQR